MTHPPLLELKRAPGTRIKRTVTWSPPAEEDHDPSVSADTGPRGGRLRVELLHVSAAPSLRMLKGSQGEETIVAVFSACNPPGIQKQSSLRRNIHNTYNITHNIHLCH